LIVFAFVVRKLDSIKRLLPKVEVAITGGSKYVWDFF
jgi:hypothetical protein